MTIMLMKIKKEEEEEEGERQYISGSNNEAITRTKGGRGATAKSTTGKTTTGAATRVRGETATKIKNLNYHKSIRKNDVKIKQ